MNFTASGKLDSTNSLVLTFASPLQKDLLLSDFTVAITDFSSFIYTLQKWKGDDYYIQITYSENITSDRNLTLEFVNPSTIRSIYGGFLLTQVICLPVEISELVAAKAAKLAQSQATSSTVTSATTSASVGIAMINPNPASLWSFISTVQMLCYIELSNIELPPKFKGYLKGLKKYNMAPNVFSYFVPRTGGQKPFAVAYEFGFTDNLLLFNSGSYLTVIILMAVFLLFTLTLSKFKHVKPFSYNFAKSRIEKTLKNYKYSAFLRFWITCYLDIVAASIIAIITTSAYGWGSVLNLTVACLLLVFYI